VGKLGVLVRLPFGRAHNLNLSLLTPGSSGDDSLLRGNPVQLRLSPVTNDSRNTWSGGGSNVCQLSIFVRLPFGRAHNLNLPLLTSVTSHDSLLGCQPVQLRLSPVSDNSGHLGTG